MSANMTAVLFVITAVGVSVADVHHGVDQHVSDPVMVAVVGSLLDNYVVYPDFGFGFVTDAKLLPVPSPIRDRMFIDLSDRCDCETFVTQCLKFVS